MTKADKFISVKKTMPNATDAEIKETIKTVDWLQKWHETLVLMHKQFMNDTGDKLDLMEFKMFIYETDRTLPKHWHKTQAELN